MIIFVLRREEYYVYVLTRVRGILTKININNFIIILILHQHYV